jgi:hypothetical protein
MSNTPENWIDIVRRKAAQMRFGSVHVTIHEGRVTQVEATEKTRLSGELATFADRAQPEESANGRGRGTRE